MYLKEVSGQYPYSFVFKMKAGVFFSPNVGNFLLDYMALHPRRHLSPYFIHFAEFLFVEGLLKHKFCEYCISTCYPAS
jgi:hypothetical protein